MARRACLLLVTCLTLSACSRPADQTASGGQSAARMAEPAADAAAEAAAPAGSATRADGMLEDAAPVESRAQRPQVVTAPVLAYAYDYAITAPPKGVRVLAARHEAACQKAGSTVCQVVGASVSEDGPDQVRANLSIRATPAWLTKFRAGLSGEAKDAGGRLARATTETEDLSRALIDTEAALKAKTTLRDRLQQLLASRPGKLSEMLDLERELARVQGEIDATQSELAVMRTRVATSKLDIEYTSTGVLAPEGVGAPIASAIGGIAGGLAMTLAIMIHALTWGGPWVLLAAGLWWLWRKRRKDRPERAKATDVAKVEGPKP